MPSLMASAVSEEERRLFTAYESLAVAQKDGLESALWAALRALEESAALSRRLTARARERNLQVAAANFEERARTAEHHADLIRQVLLNDKNAASTEEEKKEG
ncbi:MAG TPA: hypothetical protein VNN62_12110 [Methylomirabilota bacterium]|nr:hypothetical protein [Methylomirabilota bacterium]